MYINFYIIIFIQFKPTKSFVEFIPNYYYKNNINYYNPNISINNNINNNSEINILKNKLIEEKNTVIYLTNENLKLKNIIVNLNKEIANLENKNKILENNLNLKNIETQKPKNTYTNNTNSYNYLITSIKPGEKVMTVNFVSMGTQDIGHYSIACKNTDVFVKLEEKLYNDYPKFKDYETYFEVKTKRIKRFKTLEENHIENNDIINVFTIDE